MSKFNDSEKEEIRRLAKEAFSEELAAISESQIDIVDDQTSVQIPENYFLKCLGKVKNFFVWVVQNPKATIASVYLTTKFLTGFYGDVQLVTEYFAPNSLPDLKVVIRNLHDTSELEPLPPKSYKPQPEKFLVVNDQWLNLTSDLQLDIIEIDFDDEKNPNQFTLIPEGSGIIEPELFNRGRELVGTGTSILKLDHEATVVKESPPPPPIA